MAMVYSATRLLMLLQFFFELDSHSFQGHFPLLLPSMTDGVMTNMPHVGGTVLQPLPETFGNPGKPRDTHWFHVSRYVI